MSREIGIAIAFGNSRHKARALSTNYCHTFHQERIASRTFLRDNPNGASVNWWPGATVCTVPFRQSIWLRMRLMTRCIAS